MRAAVVALVPGASSGVSPDSSSDAVGATGPASVTVAVPVGPSDTLAEFESLVDRIVCVSVPEQFWAVGQAYVDFTQTTDAEVARLLAG